MPEAKGNQTDVQHNELELLQPEDETLLHQIENNPRILEVMQRRYHSGPLPSSDDMIG